MKKHKDKDVASARRPNAERREESMTLILDHAEAEFAANGYNGTTLARVAEVAGIDTALMRYYFGDKEKLFAAVFRRRGPQVNEARFKAFADYEAKFGDEGTLEGVIECFVRPAFEMAQFSQGHRNYAAIVAYVNSSRGAMYTLMSEVFDDISKALVHHMQRVMPEASRESLYWGYHFLTGAFTFSLGETGRIDRISDGEVHSSDFATMADQLPTFAASGIRALCAGNESGKSPLH